VGECFLVGLSERIVVSEVINGIHTGEEEVVAEADFGNFFAKGNADTGDADDFQDADGCNVAMNGNARLISVFMFSLFGVDKEEGVDHALFERCFDFFVFVFVVPFPV